MKDLDFIKNYNHLYYNNHKKAAKDLGVSYVTILNWLKKQDAPKAVKDLLAIQARGYLPSSGGWQYCYIDSNNELVTPYGKVSCGHLAFFHKYQWSAKHYADEYKKLKQKKDLDLDFMDDLQDRLLDLVGYISSKNGTDS